MSLNFKDLLGGGGRPVILLGGKELFEVTDAGVFQAVPGNGGAIGIAASDIPADSVTPDETAQTVLQYAEVTITSANITGTNAGQLGHANGYVLVAGITGYVMELIACVLIYDQAVKAYTGGGDVSVNWSGGGAAITGVLAKEEFCAHNGDTVNILRPLTTAAQQLPVNSGLNLVAAAAFTQPDTAAGVVRAKVVYRVHEHGL